MPKPQLPQQPNPFERAKDTDIVIFRKFPDGAIIALFPNSAAVANNPWPCESYMHVGQHGAADPGIVADTQPARPEEYAALKAELEQIGYRLDVHQRFPRDDQDRRQAELRHIPDPAHRAQFQTRDNDKDLGR
jgi:hypothetical protein